MTYFRGELTGVRSIVNHFVKNWKRDKNEKVDKNLELWCDNESTLKAIDPKVNSTFIGLQRLLQELRKVTLNHVKGHQDNSAQYDQLTFPARLNVDCDAQAKKMMQDKGVMSGRAVPSEGTEVAFYCLFGVN